MVSDNSELLSEGLIIKDRDCSWPSEHYLRLQYPDSGRGVRAGAKMAVQKLSKRLKLGISKHVPLFRGCIQKGEIVNN